MFHSSNPNIQPKIADQDIIISKNGWFQNPDDPTICTSNFMGHEYKAHEIQTLGSPLNVLVEWGQARIKEGFHGFMDPNKGSLRFIIPGGSTYFVNEEGEVVSDGIAYLSPKG